jgi:chromosome segregation ATPase
MAEIDSVREHNKQLQHELEIASKYLHKDQSSEREPELEKKAHAEGIEQFFEMLREMDPFFTSYRVEDAISALRAIQAKIIENSETISALQSERLDRINQLEQFNNALRGKDESICQLNERVQELDEALSVSEVTLGQHNQLLTEKGIEIAKLGENSVPKDQHALLLAELEEIRFSLSDKQTESELLRTECDSLKLQSTLNSKNESLIQQLNSDISMLHESEMMLKLDLDDLKATALKNTELELQLAASSKLLEENVSEKEIIQAEVVALMQKLTELEHRISEADLVNNQWQKYAGDLEAQLSTVHHELQELRNQLEEAKKLSTISNNDNHSAVIDTIRERSQVSEDFLTSRTVALEKEILILESKNSELALLNIESFDQIEELKLTDSELRKRILELETHTELLTEKAIISNELILSSESLQSEKIHLETELQYKLAELQDCEAKLDDTLVKLNDLSNNFYELETAYNQQNCDLQNKTANLDTLEYENAQLLEQLRSGQSSERRLLDELAELNSAVEMMSRKEADLKFELNELVDRSNQEIDGLKNDNRTGIALSSKRALEDELSISKKKIVLLEKDVTTLAELLKSTSDYPNGRSVSNSEYISLCRKAAKVELLQNEIQDLSTALQIASSEFENTKLFLAKMERPDEHNVITEMRQLFIKESDAVKAWMLQYQNYQKESLVLKEAAQKEVLELREEFDELASLYDATNRELTQVKSQLDVHGNKSNAISHFNPEIFPVQELSSLNKLVESLETDRKTLGNEIVIMKQRYDSLLVTKQKELDLLNSKLSRMQVNDQIAVDEYKNRIQSLEFELKEVRARLKDVTLDLQQAANDARHSEKRISMLENERVALLDEQHHQREIFDNELYHAINLEQQRSRDQLSFKVKDLRSSFDGTMDEMLRKQSQLEQMLDESERLLLVDRETFHNREQQLLDELRYLHHDGSGRWPQDLHRYEDLEQERVHLESKLHNAHIDNRQLRKSLDIQANQFLKERYDLLTEISNLKSDLEAFEYQVKDNDSSRIIRTLQEQKSVRFY